MPKSRQKSTTASSTRSSGSSRSSTATSTSSKFDQSMSNSPSPSEQQIARSESPPSSLYFITTDSSPARIRSHVMLNYHRNKRVSSQREQQGESSGHASGAENRLDNDVVILERGPEAMETRPNTITTALPTPQRIIGSISMGHAPHEFPIEMTRRSYELVLHIHNEACARTWAPFRDVYFPLALRDEANFYQLLSTADRHLCHLKAEPNSPGATAYQSKAIKSIMNRLKDPVEGVSDGVISTVLFFLGQDHMWGDHDRFMVHKSSLDKMIRLRGGIEALDDNPLLRYGIFWIDIASACTFGTQPLYAPPPERLHKWPDPQPPTPSPADDPSDSFPRICSRWHHAYPHHAVLIQLLMDVHHMTRVVKARSPAIWRDPWYMAQDINPLTWRLLAPLPTLHTDTATPAGTNPMLQPSLMDKIELPIRLAATLFISHYREAFLPFHRSYALHVTRLQAALLISTTTASTIPAASSQYPQSFSTPIDDPWHLIADIRLWVFVMGGLCAATDNVERPFFIEGICRLMRALGLMCWEDVNNVVTGFLWSSEVVGGGVGWGELGANVMSVFASAGEE